MSRPPVGLVLDARENPEGERSDRAPHGGSAAAGERRHPWRAVTVPKEHGGWGLTLEPIVVALIVAPSLQTVSLCAAALLAFLARTPLKVVLVDLFRRRHLPRTTRAGLALSGEALVAFALVALVVARTDPQVWWPVLIAAPLVAVELWFDMRSRSRRLLPELCGAVGIAAVAALALLADGRDVRLAVAVWLVLAARPVTAIVLVREQVRALHGHRFDEARTLAADGGAVLLALAAVGVDRHALAGAVAVLGAIVVQRLLRRRPTSRAVVLGLRQSGIGIVLSVVLALGVVA